MQAIVVKYYPATNTKGSRYKASCAAGSVWVPYPYGISSSDAALYAAIKLQHKLGWQYDLAEGNTKDCTVFVPIPPNRHNVTSFTMQNDFIIREA